MADAKYLNLYEPPPPMVYMNRFQEGRGASSDFALRTSVNPTAIVSDVRRVVGEVVPNVSVGKVTTLTEQIDASIVVERLVMLLSVAFGAVGALLAAIGLYGLLAYTVSRRTTEIGVRMRSARRDSRLRRGCSRARWPSSPPASSSARHWRC